MLVAMESAVCVLQGVIGHEDVGDIGGSEEGRRSWLLWSRSRLVVSAFNTDSGKPGYHRLQYLLLSVSQLFFFSACVVITGAIANVQ